MMDRRTFLGTMTAAAVLSQRLAWAAAHKISKIGVQLYTVRDAMEKDFDGTLAKVAAIGYKEVELAGFEMDGEKVSYFGRSPKEVRAGADRNGLAVPASHVNYTSLSPENFPHIIEASHVIGQSYIVNPWIDETVRQKADGWKQAAEAFNRAGASCKQAGLQFAYHNHWFEFIPVEGQLPYDILLKETDPNLVKMELDLCWIVVGGGDPVTYFKRYPGRFPLVHLKDVKEIPKVSEGGSQNFGDSMPGMTEVGSGIIDWKKILSYSQEAGIKHYFVEHDKPADPFASIKTSYDYLAKLRF
jgi:sugar phosphate isomerase/epimerase